MDYNSSPLSPFSASFYLPSSSSPPSSAYSSSFSPFPPLPTPPSPLLPSFPPYAPPLPSIEEEEEEEADASEKRNRAFNISQLSVPPSPLSPSFFPLSFSSSPPSHVAVTFSPRPVPSPSSSSSPFSSSSFNLPAHEEFSLRSCLYLNRRSPHTIHIIQHSSHLPSPSSSSPSSSCPSFHSNTESNNNTDRLNTIQNNRIVDFSSASPLSLPLPSIGLFSPLSHSPSLEVENSVTVPFLRSLSSFTIHCLFSCIKLENAHRYRCPPPSSSSSRSSSSLSSIHSYDCLAILCVASIFNDRIMNRLGHQSSFIQRKMEEEMEEYERRQREAGRENELLNPPAPRSLLKRKSMLPPPPPPPPSLPFDSESSSTPPNASNDYSAHPVSSDGIASTCSPLVPSSSSPPSSPSSSAATQSFYYSQILHPNWLQLLNCLTTTSSSSSLSSSSTSSLCCNLNIYLVCIMLAIKYLIDQPRSIHCYTATAERIHRHTKEHNSKQQEQEKRNTVNFHVLDLSVYRLLEHSCIACLGFDCSFSDWDYIDMFKSLLSIPTLAQLAKE